MSETKHVTLRFTLLFSIAWLILLGVSGMNQGPVVSELSPVLPVMHSSFNSANDYVSHVGDLVIEDVVYTLENTTFEQTGNVIVKGTGRLELKDSIFILNQSKPSEFSFELQDDALLYVNSSDIQSNHDAILQLGQAASLECDNAAFDRISIMLHDESEISAKSSYFYQVIASQVSTIGMIDCWSSYLETGGNANVTVNCSFCGGINTGGVSSVNFMDCTAEFLWCTESSTARLQLCVIPSIQTRDEVSLLGVDLTANEIEIAGNSSVSLSYVEATDLTLSNTGHATLIQSSFNNLWISGWGKGTISGLNCEGIHLIEHAVMTCDSTVASYLALEDSSKFNLSTSTISTVDVWDSTEMTVDSCVFDTIRTKGESVVHIFSTTVETVEMTESSSLWCDASDFDEVLLSDTSTLHTRGITIRDLQALDGATAFLDLSTVLSTELDCAYCIISNSTVENAITYSLIQANNCSLETVKVRSTKSLFTGCVITGLYSELGANVTAVNCVLYGGFSRQTSILSLYDCKLTWLLFAFEVGECRVFNSTITGVEAGGESWILLDNTTVGGRGILLRENNTVALANYFTSDGAFTIWETGRIIRYFLAQAEFANGTPLEGSPIQVFLGVSEILSGVTDSNGDFPFNIVYVSLNISSIRQDYILKLPDYTGVNLIFTYDRYNLVIEVSEPLEFSFGEYVGVPGISNHKDLGRTNIIKLFSTILVGLNLWFILILPAVVLLTAEQLRATYRNRQEDCQNEK